MLPLLAMVCALVLLTTAVTPVHAQGQGLGPLGIPEIVEGVSTYHLRFDELYQTNLSPSDVALSDGSRAMLWQFTARVGECLTFRMNSPDFDAYLLLRYGQPFGELIASDDDSGGGTNALLRVQLPRGGTYFLTATSAGSGASYGNYSLRVSGC